MQSNTASFDHPTLLPPGMAPVSRNDITGCLAQRPKCWSEPNGQVLKTVHNEKGQLIGIIRRTDGGRVEIDLDPLTGDRKRACEIATMPDGNLIRDEIIYQSTMRSSQLVTIARRSGHLVRTVERQYLGSRITYQGQTDYNEVGEPACTVNQHKDPHSDQLTHREQIYWLKEGHRAVTEHFYFSSHGRTIRYVKVIHYAFAGVFSQETQDFQPETGKMHRQELAGFAPDGRQNYLDVLTFGSHEQLQKLTCVFFDKSGNPIQDSRLAHSA